MNYIQRRNLNISLLLVFCLIFAPFIDVAEASIFGKIREKTQEKVEQLQQREWWITKAVGKATGFVAGKAGGLLGAAVGYVIGASFGGPVAAGMGAMFGYRIGDIVVKTFAKAVGETIAKRKLETGEEVTLGTVVETITEINKASLSAESVGAVIGDLIGGSLGAVAGIALLAGASPLAIPLLGTFSAGYLGSKLGTAVGRGIGRLIGRKALKKGYEAYATGTEDSGIKGETLYEENSGKKADDIPTTVQNDKAIRVENGSKDITKLKTAYEQAYIAYTRAITSVDTTNEEKNLLFAEYRECYDAYRAATAESSNK
ncbi:MAG: hypothetical protein PHQ02_05730 [Candidatus Riflebacteria bacterium]|nr:hypothetical protein [Candidatus Riflebacteria bacterium]